ncbi:Voltage-gated Ion Channel [Phytophthora megakarya]|uniref:Voltage-gated Ion Channel n=1 Tax=Phytophthora megakarya TaxID=4795 RepID=A0A225X1U7_9STRA|nr:Voltage-gated Ion Channel [Phytophthora megakarya]
MCFAVFLGLSDTQGKCTQALGRLNRTIPVPTKRILHIQQRLRLLYKLRARNDSFCIVLAGLSVFTVWLQFRAIWRSSAKYHRDLPLQSPGEAYAALLLLITLILLHQVHYRYCIKMEIMALRNQISLDCCYSLWRSPRLLLFPFITELLLCGVFLPPFVHDQLHFNEPRYALPQTSSQEVPSCPTPLAMTADKQACELHYSYPLEIVNMIVMVRLYWFARIIRNQLMKQVIADKSTMISPVMFTAKYMPADSLWWSFRISFALRPAKVFLSLFVTLWMSTAAAVSIFERPFPSKLSGEDHALWLSLVTMAGVGYGDSYPITMGGRIVIVLGAVFGGLAFISLMTSEFLSSLKGTKREHAVLSALDSMKWERSLRVSAARLIHAAWALHQGPVSVISKQRNKRSKERELLKAAHQFKLCRKQKPMQSTNNSHLLQRSELSTIYLREMDGWMSLRQVQTAAQLDALEQQLSSMTTSLQSWGVNLCKS